MYVIMSSANNDSVSCSFPVWMPFISFSCLIGMARTFSTTLNRSGVSGHPFLVPYLRGKAFSFCLLNMIFAVGLSCMAFITLRYAPCTPTLLRVFIMNGCCTLSNTFLASIDTIMWFLFFLLCDVLHLLIWEYCAILGYLEWIHLIMAYDVFNVLLDLICQYFFKDFHFYVHQRYWPIVFFLCCVFISFWV